MTKNQRSFDSAVIKSSLMPSEKYSCSGSPLIFTNGSTATAGRSGRGNAARGGEMSSGFTPVPGAPSPSPSTRTAATKRTPLRAIVRISFCPSPVSPIALRAALIRLARVESDTIRPAQTASMRSSLLTTRSRFRTR